MSSELKKKTVKGVVWSTAENFSMIGINFIVGIILARLLSPSDYGLIAMITIFMAISQAFIDSGFRNALIRKPTITDADYCTAFYFNIIAAAVLYGLLFAMSPWVAVFYNKPILCDLLRVEALTIVIGSFNIVQRVRLTRSLNFKLIAIISVTSNLVSCGVGLFLAFTGYGVWSLVFMHITTNTMQMLLLWLTSPWRPRSRWSGESFRYLWGFGSKLLASGLLDKIYHNIYPIVIGKFFSAASLGQYTRAHGFADLPSSNLTGVLQKVTFPVLSKMQDDTLRLAENYRRMLRLSAFVIFPLMVGMAALARPLVLTLITDKWVESIVYLQIICFGMMWYPIHAINLNLLQVKGRSDLFLRLEIIKKVIVTIAMVIAIPFGIVAMCVGSVCTSLISLVINTYYTGRLIDVGFIMQMKDLTPTLLLSLLMGALIYAFTQFVHLPDGALLAVGITVGAAIYLAIARITRMPEFQEAINIIHRK
ncbi:MAG: lipopolysaccharide biosynthesis protein [Muribaculaceae bacterium]|nr:lipopolysaccharide biosynthesis protein [Muribaculaceae bacterium]